LIDHIEIQTRDVASVAGFYAAVLAPLGYTLQVDDRAKGFGAGPALDFFIVEGAPSGDVHYAFQAPSRVVVDAVYEIARQRGFELDRAPALAPHIHPN